MGLIQREGFTGHTIIDCVGGTIVAWAASELWAAKIAETLNKDECRKTEPVLGK